MTQEEKELLLKDLCARLPYGVRVKLNRRRETSNKLTIDWLYTYSRHVEDIKPYLRPMSSMTEEEKADLEAYSKQELDKYADAVFNNADKDIIRYSQVSLIYKDIDWYNAHHIDYRGLIPMGLAIEAPEGMYVIK